MLKTIEETVDQEVTTCTVPTKWYNLRSGLPEELPPAIENETNHSIEMMQSIRPKALNEQDATNEEYVDIPDEVIQHYYDIGRPTPLMRATKLVY